MKNLLLVTILSLISFPVLANIDFDDLNQNHCQEITSPGPMPNSTVSNPVFHHNYGAIDYLLQRKEINGSRVYELNYLGQTLILQGATKIRDFDIIDSSIWTVGSMGLQEFDFSGNLMATYLIPNTDGRAKLQPRGMFYHKDSRNIYLASGAVGLVTFNIDSRSFTFRDLINTDNGNGHRSAAVAVVGDNNDRLYIAMTGRTEKGFNGIVSYDLKTKKMINTAEYDRRRSGVVFPYAQIYEHNNRVYINNAGWIHRFEKKDILSKKKVRPFWKAIPMVQDGYTQYIMLVGDFIFNQNEILGCGRFLNIQTDKRESSAFRITI